MSSSEFPRRHGQIKVRAAVDHWSGSKANQVETDEWSLGQAREDDSRWVT